MGTDEIQKSIISQLTKLKPVKGYTTESIIRKIIGEIGQCVECPNCHHTFVMEKETAVTAKQYKKSKNSRYHKWSYEDERIIIDMKAKGCSNREIADKLGASADAVSQRYVRIKKNTTPSKAD